MDWVKLDGSEDEPQPADDVPQPSPPPVPHAHRPCTDDIEEEPRPSCVNPTPPPVAASTRRQKILDRPIPQVEPGAPVGSEFANPDKVVALLASVGLGEEKEEREEDDESAEFAALHGAQPSRLQHAALHSTSDLQGKMRHLTDQVLRDLAFIVTLNSH